MMTSTTSIWLLSLILATFGPSLAPGSRWTAKAGPSQSLTCDVHLRNLPGPEQCLLDPQVKQCYHLMQMKAYFEFNSMACCQIVKTNCHKSVACQFDRKWFYCPNEPCEPKGLVNHKDHDHKDDRSSPMTTGSPSTSSRPKTTTTAMTSAGTSKLPDEGDEY